MKLAQLAELLERRLKLARRGSVSHRQQLVGGFSHRRNHNDRTPVQPLADNARDAPDGLRRFDGRSAELHHDHQSRYPSAFITSAFSTAAPAAPRTVLWPSATNL